MVPIAIKKNERCRELQLRETVENFLRQVEAKRLMEPCLRRRSHRSKVGKLKREVL